MFKKILTAIFVIFLTACGINHPQYDIPSDKTEYPPETFKSIADIYTSGAIITRFGSFNDLFYIFFNANDESYRACADVSEETINALDSIDPNANDYDDQYRKITGKLQINQLINLTKTVIPQKELVKWRNKTGQDLIDDGWEVDYKYSAYDMCYAFYKNLQCYKVQFKKEDVSQNDDLRKEVASLKIKSITHDDVGDINTFN